MPSGQHIFLRQISYASLPSVCDLKVGIVVRVSDDLTKRVRAGDVIREIAPIVGGRGGGKPDMAEGGGTDPAKLQEAIDASYSVIEKMLGRGSVSPVASSIIIC